MTLKILQNVATFMGRVQMTGNEAVAWCEAMATINQKIAEFQTPVSDPSLSPRSETPST